MAAVVDVGRWQEYGGTVLQSTASESGRVTRTFVAPSGEIFRTWKECLKYMATELKTSSPHANGNGNCSKKTVPESNGSGKPEEAENDHDKSEGSAKKKRARKAGATMDALDNNDGEGTGNCTNGSLATDGSVNKKGKGSEVKNDDGKGKKPRREDSDSNSEPTVPEKQNKGSKKSTEKGTKKGSKRSLSSTSGEEKVDSDESEQADLLKQRRPKRAAAAAAAGNFKEKQVDLADEKDNLITIKRDRVVDGEEVAIVMTAESGETQPPRRRILDFIVHDEEGKSQPIEALDIVPLYLSTLVLPLQGNLDKERGFRCEGFGPLISWSVSGYDDFKPTIWLCTETAEYTCVKPASVYKKNYDMLFEKAVLCVEVYRALSKPDGGNPELGLDEMVARVSRSLLSSKHLGSSNIISKDYILSQGAFVANQLAALDEDATGAEQLFSGLPVLVALENESKSRGGRIRASNHSLHSNGNGGGIKIRDSSSALSNGEEEDALDDDERLARLLQEQEDRKAFNRQQSRRPQPAKGKFYIKINEDEIAGDYPLPAFYKTEEEEMDEYVLFEDDSAFLAPEELPRRMLHDWALYNSDSRLVPLELLPMLAGAETDTEIFGSGLMTEDDGSGYSLEEEEGSTGKSGEDAGSNRPEGIRIYLSAIKEWMIEFGASMLFVSIRTDGAWYRLGKPSPQYEKWYKPILKTARLAIQIITLLKAESRASKLSFADVVKRLAEMSVSDVSFISSKIAEVERYVVVHGQIILQQFAEYPDETIRRSAFVMGLGKNMEEKRHVKLALSKKKMVIRKGRNLNPRAGLSPDGTRPKPMRAIMTKLVNRIWSEYYASNKADGEGGEDQIVSKGNGEEPELEEEAVEEESDDEEETILAVGSKGRAQKLSASQSKACLKKMKWSGKSIGVTKAKEPVYRKAIVNSGEVSIGDVLSVDLEGLCDYSPGLLLVEYLFEKKNGSACAHGRVLLCGSQTVLGNAADAREVFLTNECEDVELSSTKGSVIVQMRNRLWGHKHRMENISLDEAERLRVKSREEEGLPVEYFCRSLYCPERGAFLRLPRLGEDICVDNSVCKACEARDDAKEKKQTCLLPDNEGFRHGGVEYRVKDFLYVAPTVFLPQGKEEPEEKFKAGRNKGLRAFAICQLLEVKSSDGVKKAVKSKAINLIVRRFFRPEDVSPDKAYKSDMREVFYSEETATVNVENVVGKCGVQKQSHVDNLVSDSFDDIFFCNCIFDPKKGTVKQLPANIRLGAIRPSEKGKAVVDEVATAKRKGKHIEGEEPALDSDNCMHKTSRLATLDIFAGCGGLSEGLQQSGSTITKWAIEYDHVAAEAFKLNHPGVHVFNENCNVILRSMMEKFGSLDDCISTPEAEALCLKLGEEVKSQLPAPGEVDFINGGPPCQGFSGMNRFSQRAWSKVQCEMILSFLSFADFYRPRFFLLENVRNFVSFNKGQTFRLTMASLLEMGYQVRFGVLQAGNYGVSQSRKRAFIWAAAPGEELPEWPEPRYVFASSQLKIALPGGLHYAAVRDAAEGAPLRSITVRDAIGDLPPVGNGADKLDVTYGESPQSWFQKYIRGSATVLYDHICKEMNELNYIRCQRIPRRPGSDWRDLPEEKVKLSTGQLVDLIPWCLPNTADRHNQWKGLFGRLDWDGNFPTSVTDPQPMGKVGMCFHPDQDRIVTVRECARSQGFPDSYRFYGNIHCKHRQIGNAVPPPLAKALGMKLKEVLNAQAKA